MSNDVIQMDASFEDKHWRGFQYIENTLSKKLDSMCIVDLKYELIQWRNFDSDTERIDSLRSLNQNNQIYVDIIEHRISLCIKEMRDKLNVELTTIDDAVARKEKARKNKERLEIRDCAREKDVLVRLNRMPEDMVRLIGEFAFTPKLRCQLMRHQFPTFTDRLNKIKLPKLKLLSRCLMNGIQKIGEKIFENKSIIKCFPKNTEICENLWKVIRIKNHVREALKKGDKIEEIEKNIQCTEDVIDALEKLGYPITARKARRVLLILYSTLIIASKPEFNKKTRRT
jgi:hypothetical protein